MYLIPVLHIVPYSDVGFSCFPIFDRCTLFRRILFCAPIMYSLEDLEGRGGGGRHLPEMDRGRRLAEAVFVSLLPPSSGPVSH